MPENVKIYGSSSSASALMDERAELTGRTRTIEVLPLDFKEFLLFKDYDVKISEPYLLESYFEEYMKEGGMPEYVLTWDIGYLGELVDSLIQKDIIARRGVQDGMLVRDLFRLMMERAGKRFTYNKIAKVTGASVDTIRRLASYFEAAFLINTIERCGKLNERLRSPRKLYASDVGIRNLITGYRDRGAIFENLVFLKIKDRAPCYLYENGTEIDFIFDKTILEVKFNDELSPAQQDLAAGKKTLMPLFIKSTRDYLKHFEGFPL